MKKATRKATFNRMDFAQVRGIVQMAIKLNMTLQGLESSLNDWEAENELTAAATPWNYKDGKCYCTNCAVGVKLPSQYCPACGNKMVFQADGFIKYSPE